VTAYSISTRHEYHLHRPTANL